MWSATRAALLICWTGRRSWELSRQGPGRRANAPHEHVACTPLVQQGWRVPTVRFALVSLANDIVTLRMSRRDVGASAKIHHHHRVFARNWGTLPRTPLHVTQQHQNSIDDGNISSVWRQRCAARPWNRIRAALRHCSRVPFFGKPGVVFMSHAVRPRTLGTYKETGVCCVG